MTLKEFSKYCTGYGSDWVKMLFSGLKIVCRPLYDYLPDKEYSFDEVMEILFRSGIVKRPE